MYFDCSVDQISILYNNHKPQTQNFIKEEIFRPTNIKAQVWFGYVYFIICSKRKNVSLQNVLDAFQKNLNGYPELEKLAQKELLPEIKRKFFANLENTPSRLSMLFWGVAKFVIEAKKWEKNGSQLDKKEFEIEI